MFYRCMKIINNAMTLVRYNKYTSIHRFLFSYLYFCVQIKLLLCKADLILFSVISDGEDACFTASNLLQQFEQNVAE